MSQEDDELERKKESRRETTESRMLTLFEKLTERVDANAEESLRRDEELRLSADATQRTVDFIIRQQAEFSAGMQELREAAARSERHWESTAATIRDLLAITQIQSQEIGALAEAQARTDAQMKETDERLKELREQMKETDERLNALIAVVERSISEWNNGGQRGPEV